MLVTRDFVLVHVPKTGGTFLNGLVREHCEVVYEHMHAPYREIPSEYRDLPALAFVRNPFEWYVSWYEHMRRHGPESKDEWEWTRFEMETCDFPRFLSLAFDLPHGFDYYSALFRGITSGCEIGRQERLRDDFVGFLATHGIQADALVEAVRAAPAVNVGAHRAYRSYYSDEDALLVERSWLARTYGYVFLTDLERGQRDHMRAEVEGWAAAYANPSS
jgi:hypothetical protein